MAELCAQQREDEQEGRQREQRDRDAVGAAARAARRGLLAVGVACSVIALASVGEAAARAGHDRGRLSAAACAPAACPATPSTRPLAVVRRIVWPRARRAPSSMRSRGAPGRAAHDARGEQGQHNEEARQRGNDHAEAGCAGRPRAAAAPIGARLSHRGRRHRRRRSCACGRRRYRREPPPEVAAAAGARAHGGARAAADGVPAAGVPLVRVRTGAAASPWLAWRRCHGAGARATGAGAGCETPAATPAAARCEPLVAVRGACARPPRR